MRILLIKLSAIGDIVHTLPAFSAVRQALPDAEIDWVAESSAAEILRGNRLINRLIEIDTKHFRKNRSGRDLVAGLRMQTAAIRDSNYDVAVDFQGLIKSAIIARLSGAPLRFGYSRESLREPAAAIFYNQRIAAPQNHHIIYRHLQLAASSFGIPIPKTLDFPIFPKEVHLAEAEKIARMAGGPFAMLNLGGGWPTKLWSAERFGQLGDLIAEHLGLRPIIVYGPGEEEIANSAVASSKSGALITSSPSLKGFFALARLASVYVGGDTGPTHLAVAAGAPVVGIYGPTDWRRNGSPCPEDLETGRNDIECRKNCYRRSCDNWICMDIEVKAVFAAVARRLNAAVFEKLNANTEAIK
ncbi:MAG: lipopolysaccharide heptosyltransferase I [Blastocatellia bacterium]